jgi:hypothetical protein
LDEFREWEIEANFLREDVISFVHSDSKTERKGGCLQVQSALNERVSLQCSLLLTNLDEPLPLNAAELVLLDECWEWEAEAGFLRKDVVRSRKQIEHLLSMHDAPEVSQEDSARRAGRPVKVDSSAAQGTLHACRVLLDELLGKLNILSNG